MAEGKIYSFKNFAGQFMGAIKRAGTGALMAGGRELNARATPRVPVWRGRLRRTMKTVREGQNVSVQTGDESTPYAARQYYENLRHLGSVNELQDLTAHFRGSSGAGKIKRAINLRIRRRLLAAQPGMEPKEIKRRVAGGGARSIYARAHRLAVLSGMLARIRPEWYDVTMLLEGDEVEEVVANFLLGAV